MGGEFEDAQGQVGRAFACHDREAALTVAPHDELVKRGISKAGSTCCTPQAFGPPRFVLGRRHAEPRLPVDDELGARDARSWEAYGIAHYPVSPATGLVPYNLFSVK